MIRYGRAARWVGRSPRPSRVWRQCRALAALPLALVGLGLVILYRLPGWIHGALGWVAGAALDGAARIAGGAQ